MRIILIALAFLGGCADDMHWTGGTGNLADFAKDDYACRKDARAYGSTAFVPFAGTVVAAPQPDMGVYRQCMVASGYHLK